MGRCLSVTTLIYVFRPDGTEIGQFNGGGMDGPWDTAIDGEDNVWVANFGPLQSGTISQAGSQSFGESIRLRVTT